MRKLLLSTAFVALCVAPNSSFAASDETNAFVANVRVDALFLSEASRLADDRSNNEGLRAYAGSEVVAERAVVDDIGRRVMPEMAQAVAITLASNEVMTGRSAAVVGETSGAPLTAPVGIGALMPAATLTLDRLSTSKGQAFDTLYKATQVSALRQLVGLYEAYGMTGDDAALRQLAKTELAATNERLAALGRF